MLDGVSSKSLSDSIRPASLRPTTTPTAGSSARRCRPVPPEPRERLVHRRIAGDQGHVGIAGLPERHVGIAGRLRLELHGFTSESLAA